MHTSSGSEQGLKGFCGVYLCFLAGFDLSFLFQGPFALKRSPCMGFRVRGCACSPELRIHLEIVEHTLQDIMT